ncbi:MAG: hypothetical protein K2M95_08055 [Clostridiales bacterium]|nr:hypothetical protein [Clostridiales bacterium]
MNSVTVRAFGKVNLSLNICGVCGKLHALDSVISSIDLCDDVTVHRNSDGALRVVFAPCDDAVSASDCKAIPAENSVQRALNALKRDYPDFGVTVEVKKRLPFAGGLGGSSADAAGVLCAVNFLYPNMFSPRAILRAAAKAGSDVPVMLAGGYARLTGTGGEMERFSAPPLSLCVVKPSGGVESKEAYRIFDELHASGRFCPSDNARLIEALKQGDFEGIAGELNNALAKAAISICPSMRDALDAIKVAGGVPFVTGSGSCCCGLFPSLADAECATGILSNSFTAYAVSTVLHGCEKI